MPWNKLPQLRQLAPEFYDPLLHHTSYSKLLLRFLFDQEISLYSRLVRGVHVPSKVPLATIAK